MNIEYASPFGTLTLKRFPYFPESKAQQNLQAWDGADTLLLEEMFERSQQKDMSTERILILNDQFGALSVALRTYNPDTQSDSFLSHTAIEKNLQENNAELSGAVRCIPSTQALEGRYDLVLIRIPKSLQYLKHQLCALREHIDAETTVIATAMAKGLSPNVREIFQQQLGPADQSLAKRKARLIHCTPNPEQWRNNEAEVARETTTPATTTTTEAGSFVLETQPNVFAHTRIDPGTKVFLEHVKQLPSAASVLDLACGSGIMGIAAAHACGAENLYLCDESYMAVASAKENAAHNCPDITTQAMVAHSIPAEFPEVDLIVNNPPFHQQQTMTSDIALQMFRDAKRHLKHGGQLWVIANRHLDYYRVLKKLFGNCSNQSRHNKYVLLQCTKLPN